MKKLREAFRYLACTFGAHQGEWDWMLAWGRFEARTCIHCRKTTYRPARTTRKDHP